MNQNQPLMRLMVDSNSVPHSKIMLDLTVCEHNYKIKILIMLIIY